MWRVLCVEDDARIADQIAEFFQNWRKDNPYGQFEVEKELDFAKAIRRLANERFDLVTLDLHGEKDPEPGDDNKDPTQQGTKILDELRKTRFLPVIFYSGYAEKIRELESPVVRIVKKGEDDLNQVRNAAKQIYETGLPQLVRHIDEEQRSYLWDTVDKHWAKFSTESNSDELPYLLARRLATQLSRESIKKLLDHKRDYARPVEFYIYPPLDDKIKTGNIYGPDEHGKYWVVATPACDFAQNRVEFVLLVGGTVLSAHELFAEWQKSKWIPNGNEPPDKASGTAYNKLRNLITNAAGERMYFLPGTFFIPDLVVDMQLLKQYSIPDLGGLNLACKLDSPFREEFLLRVSKYYGRIGTPDLEVPPLLGRFTGN